MTKDSRDEQKEPTLREMITLLPLEDQKRLSNWRIFSTNTSLQPTKGSPTSAGSDEEKTPLNSRESASQE